MHDVANMKTPSLPFAVGLSLLLGTIVRGQTRTNLISRETVRHAGELVGLNFSDTNLDLMLPGLRTQLANFEALRKIDLDNGIPPALLFNPIPQSPGPAATIVKTRRPPRWSSPGKVKLPVNPDDLAFYSVGEMAVLIKSRRITSKQLTRFHLDRLKKYGPKLECVITLTEELAMQQARRADREIAAGKYRGPLHGIPYGAKDLLATKGIKTTWGSVPYQNQVIDEDATVVKRLEEAGAVLVAKLTSGELAWDDIWFGGQTRNPWNLKQGSSGSSAGPAAASAAGLVPFAIGSETWGSIVSPATRCGVTGLRPTYGRVSRHGAMALSWSMDKLGPISRAVEDCALVFNAIYGPDGLDQTVYDLPFDYDPRIKLNKLRIGYLKGDFEKAKQNKENDAATLAKLRMLGAELVPIELPTNYPIAALVFILSVESATAFDELIRSGRVDQLRRSSQATSWRKARFVPAVEYLQANRIRYLLIQKMAKLMKQVDVYLAPSQEGDNGLLTNLTGHPCVVLPNGFTQEGTPTSICFIGQLFGEAQLLAVAKRYQDATDFHRKHPALEP